MRRKGNSNFGVMLPIWDMLFGTHVDPVTTEVRAAGIEGEPDSASLARRAFLADSAFRSGRQSLRGGIDECLNEHWFTSLAHARAVIEAWRCEYNEERPKKITGRADARAVRKTVGHQGRYNAGRL